MAMSGGKDDGAPMMEMNMTPLIDVLLVLLDLPQPDPNPPPVLIDPIKNKLVLTQDNQILWNAEPITGGQLRTLLAESLTLATEPELQFEPEALASYELSARVLNIIKASGVTKFGFVGNEKYRVFGASGSQ